MTNRNRKSPQCRPPPQLLSPVPSLWKTNIKKIKKENYCVNVILFLFKNVVIISENSNFIQRQLKNEDSDIYSTCIRSERYTFLFSHSRMSFLWRSFCVDETLLTLSIFTLWFIWPRPSKEPYKIHNFGTLSWSSYLCT